MTIYPPAAIGPDVWAVETLCMQTLARETSGAGA
jgi:hypothetical protein